MFGSSCCNLWRALRPEKITISVQCCHQSRHHRTRDPREHQKRRLTLATPGNPTTSLPRPLIKIVTLRCWRMANSTQVQVISKAFQPFYHLPSEPPVNHTLIHDLVRITAQDVNWNYRPCQHVCPKHPPRFLFRGVTASEKTRLFDCFSESRLWVWIPVFLDSFPVPDFASAEQRLFEIIIERA